MGTVFSTIDGALRQWIGEQSLFFVGTAPLAADGHVNVSPKGPIESFAVTGPTQVAYLDIVGSGAETAAHLQENGRLVVMFCSFGKRPRILRLHGRGRVIWAESPEFAELRVSFKLPPPVVLELQRAIVVLDVHRIADSCGYGVPLMEHVGERDNAARWADGLIRRGDAGLMSYKAAKNTTSMDGLAAWPG